MQVRVPEGISGFRASVWFGFGASGEKSSFPRPFLAGRAPRASGPWQFGGFFRVYGGVLWFTV